MITSNDKEYLDRIADNHVCPEHGKTLVAAWHAGENSYIIRCSEGHFPDEVTRELTPIEEFKAGKREAVKPSFSLIPKTDLATGEMLSQEAIHALVDYANRYQLDAHRGHVLLMYGKPYISLDGYLYYAGRSGSAYQLRSQPLDEEERSTYRIGENDHAWTCEVFIVSENMSFTDLGIVTQEEMVAKSPRDKTKLRSPVVAAHPWQLAQKRAEWQALRRAFPIGESEEVSKGDSGNKEVTSTMED